MQISPSNGASQKQPPITHETLVQVKVLFAKADPKTLLNSSED